MIVKQRLLLSTEPGQMDGSCVKLLHWTQTTKEPSQSLCYPDIRIPSLVWIQNKSCQSTDGGEQVALCLILTKSKRGEKPVSGAKSPMNGIHHKRFKPPPQLRRIVVRVIIASRTGKDSVPVATLNYQIQTNFRDVCSRPLSLLDSTDAVF